MDGKSIAVMVLTPAAKPGKPTQTDPPAVGKASFGRARQLSRNLTSPLLGPVSRWT